MTLPTISPLPLTRLRDPFDHKDWIFEVKFDGFRAVAYIDDGECRLVSPNGNIFKRFDPLSHALCTLSVKSAVLDGEIVCLDDKGVSQFNELIFKRGVPYFYSWDLMWLNRKDLRQSPLLERKNRLKDLIMRADNPALLFADHVDEFGRDLFRIICERQLEGIVGKHRDGRYDRTARWIKINNPDYTQSKDRHELFYSIKMNSD